MNLADHDIGYRYIHLTEKGGKETNFQKRLPKFPFTVRTTIAQTSYHRLYPWRKISHVEKFQIYVKNLNNLWSFIEIHFVFVLNLCGEKSLWRKSMWRKNDKYEVCDNEDDAW